MPLKIPICVFDAKTGLLCPICAGKLRNGQITESDILASKALALYGEHSRELDSVIMSKGHDVDKDFLMEVDEPSIPLLRSEHIRSGLERLLGGRLWVTGANTSNRGFIEDLLHPIAISELSTVWLPDGAKVSKVVVAAAGRKVDTRLSAAQKLARAARGIDLLVERRVSNEQRVDWPAGGTAEAPSVVGVAR